MKQSGGPVGQFPFAGCAINANFMNFVLRSGFFRDDYSGGNGGLAIANAEASVTSQEYSRQNFADRLGVHAFKRDA